MQRAEGPTHKLSAIIYPMESRRIPVFAAEAKESRWWFDHREEISDDIIKASREGSLGEGSKARWARLQAEKLQAEQKEKVPVPAEQRRAS
jgi:hypothetical protein